MKKSQISFFVSFSEDFCKPEIVNNKATNFLQFSVLLGLSMADFSHNCRIRTQIYIYMYGWRFSRIFSDGLPSALPRTLRFSLRSALLATETHAHTQT